MTDQILSAIQAWARDISADYESACADLDMLESLCAKYDLPGGQPGKSYARLLSHANITDEDRAAAAQTYFRYIRDNARQDAANALASNIADLLMGRTE